VIGLRRPVLPDDLPPKARLALILNVAKPLPHPRLAGDFSGAGRSAPQSAGTRRVLIGVERRGVPLYRVEDQAAGAHAAGPAVLEEAYFTCRVDPGWSFRVNAAGDILLEKA
jgi:N-methylhydantoinase A/oxoprolinase/acetone carboxylase beta subunit